jgi:hypothetical protein
VNTLPNESPKQSRIQREMQRTVMRPLLATHDVTAIYRQLQKVGFAQQRIAAITGQSQPEVSAVIHGRKVMAYASAALPASPYMRPDLHF